ncbi:hypothetical protein TELCIR_00431 [Teladorsagia circumcincta]|uniref:Uncharacterized protein n=1 Tax=Teladorsagia circumcincta TaxID=45464 RepID=A0A2G9V684_TELCI|nr:hypothetical protein TELCIR_00431 [Teladorsagia circumcincta]
MLMLLALVTIPFLLVNITAETKNITGKRQKPKNLPHQLYEEFFSLINKYLVWDPRLAKEADKELAGNRTYPDYLPVLLEREIGYPLFSAGVDVLLTLHKLWVTEELLDEVMDLCEGTKYGCNYEYRSRRRHVAVRVLCFFDEQDQ